jgi:hypothetical protein
MSMEVHEYETEIRDMQLSQDRTYFITAGKDKTAKVSLNKIIRSTPTHLYYRLSQLVTCLC